MRSLSDNQGWAQIMAGVIGGLVAIIIGVMVWYKINTSLFSAAGGATQSTIAKSAWNTTNSTAGTIWTLFPIVAIIAIAGIILAIVMGFGAAGKKS